VADILVIDDHQSIRFFIRAVLEADGHTVREAQGGAEGVQAYRERPADLVLCDLLMPEVSGLEVIELLEKESADLKVILMSAFNIAVRQDGPGRGPHRTLLKPFRPWVLLEAVRELLAGVASSAGGA